MSHMTLKECRVRVQKIEASMEENPGIGYFNARRLTIDVLQQLRSARTVNQLKHAQKLSEIALKVFEID